jgi:hypothetical protein
MTFSIHILPSFVPSSLSIYRRLILKYGNSYIITTLDSTRSTPNHFLLVDSSVTAVIITPISPDSSSLPIYLFIGYLFSSALPSTVSPDEVDPESPPLPSRFIRFL